MNTVELLKEGEEACHAAMKAAFDRLVRERTAAAADVFTDACKAWWFAAETYDREVMERLRLFRAHVGGAT